MFHLPCINFILVIRKWQWRRPEFQPKHVGENIVNEIYNGILSCILFVIYIFLLFFFPPFFLDLYNLLPLTYNAEFCIAFNLQDVQQFLCCENEPIHKPNQTSHNAFL